MKTRYAIVEEKLRTTDQYIEVLDEGTTEEQALAKAEDRWDALHPHDKAESTIWLYHGAVNDECTDMLNWGDEGYDEAVAAKVDTGTDYTPLAVFASGN